MAKSTQFDSYFTDFVTDNNGVSVTDINKGLDDLYRFFNENYYDLEESQNYLVSAHEAYYPDLVASNCLLNDQKYWWWILLLNKLDDALTDIRENWQYGIPSEAQVEQFISNSNKENENSPNSRIGSVIELN